MKAMTAEVEEHDGLYPYNGGKINQSEVCRRAGISKVTLQGPIHKESTKVEIDEWGVSEILCVRRFFELSVV